MCQTSFISLLVNDNFNLVLRNLSNDSNTSISLEKEDNDNNEN